MRALLAHTLRWCFCIHTSVQSNFWVWEERIFFPCMHSCWWLDGNSHKAGLHKSTHTKTLSYCIIQQFKRKICIIRKFDLISMFAVLSFSCTVQSYSGTCSTGLQEIMQPHQSNCKTSARLTFPVLPVLQWQEIKPDEKPPTTVITYLFDQELQSGDCLS